MLWVLEGDISKKTADFPGRNLGPKNWPMVGGFCRLACRILVARHVYLHWTAKWRFYPQRTERPLKIDPQILYYGCPFSGKINFTIPAVKFLLLPLQCLFNVFISSSG